jgi:[ribosomal protein S5]-alanine N-acetyltransferase
VIRTARLILRPARMEDLSDVHAMLSHPAAMRYWAHPEYETLAESRNWLEGMVRKASGIDFLIQHQDRVIGKAGAWRLPELGFLLHPDHWGKGLAHAAMTAVIAHLFVATDVAELTADVDPRNLACLRLLARLGFVEAGRAERTLKWRDEWCDSVYLALQRPDGHA